MGLFDQSLDHFRNALEASGTGHTLHESEVIPWAEKSSLVLSDETAVELGNPADGSVGLILWSRTAKLNDGRIHFQGPDISENSGRQSLIQLVLVQGELEDDYETLRLLRDTLYHCRLEGVMSRAQPTGLRVWYRASETALSSGLSFVHLGAAFYRRLKALEHVQAVEIYFVAGDRKLTDKLRPQVFEVEQIIGALRKFSETAVHDDCESCEFYDVCKNVEELRLMRKKARKAGQP